MFFIALSLAASPIETCADGDVGACQRVLARVGNGVARQWARGEEPAHWEIDQLQTLVQQTTLLLVAKGTPYYAKAELGRACERMPAPACPTVERDSGVARLLAYEERAAKFRDPSPWVPWEGMEVVQRGYSGQRYLALGTSLGAVRWASDDGAIRTVLPIKEVCFGPYLSGGQVWVGQGTSRSCSRVLRYDLEGTLLGERVAKTSIGAAFPLENALLIYSEGGIEERNSEDVKVAFYPYESLVPDPEISGSADGDWVSVHSYGASTLYQRGEEAAAAHFDGPCVIGGGAWWCLDDRTRSTLSRKDLKTMRDLPIDAFEDRERPPVVECGAVGLVDSVVIYKTCDHPSELPVFEPPATRVVTGQVVDSVGQPVVAADVVVREATQPDQATHVAARFVEERVVAFTETDAQGRFVLADVPAVGTIIEARAEGLFQRVEGILVESDPVPVLVEMAFKRTTRVEAIGEELTLMGVPLGADHVLHAALTTTSFNGVEQPPALYGPKAYLEGYDELSAGGPLRPPPSTPTTCTLTYQDGTPHPKQAEPWPCISTPLSLDGDWLLGLQWSTLDNGVVRVTEPNQTTLLCSGCRFRWLTLVDEDGAAHEIPSSGEVFIGLDAGMYRFDGIFFKDSQRFRGVGDVVVKRGQSVSELHFTEQLIPEERRVRVVNRRGEGVSGVSLLVWDPVSQSTLPKLVDFFGVAMLPADERGEVFAAVWDGDVNTLRERHKDVGFKPPRLSGDEVVLRSARGKAVKRVSFAGSWRARGDSWTPSDSEHLIELAPGVWSVGGEYGASMVLFAEGDVLVRLEAGGEVSVYRRE